MKKIICLLLALVMVVCMLGVLSSCGDDEACTHVDANGDLKCDKCQAQMQATACTNHTDANGDLKCDTCGAAVACTHADANQDLKCDKCGADIVCEHADANKDGRCDKCGAKVEVSECQHVDADKNGKCDKCNANIACQHVDANKDSKCDKCGKSMGSGNDDDEVNYPWDSQTLFFQMTDNSNNQELSSGCKRYLAGEDSQYAEAIDKSVRARNAQAEYLTKIKVKYDYWPEGSEYGWGSCIEKIEGIINSGTTTNVPDMYCNFVYDMVGASVKGYFANIKSTSRGAGELKGLNYFEFLDDDYDEAVDNRGYMHEYMESVTLSQHKMYILASDYFTDMIRAFFIIPVSVQLIESVGESVTGGDLNGDGVWTIDDFYQQVRDMEWTYELLAAYSKAVYKADSNANTTTKWLGDDVVGFAFADGGVAASGLLYTTSVVIIEKKFDESKNDYEYFYPTTNDGLKKFCDATTALFASEGVVHVNTVTDKTSPYDLSAWGGAQGSLHAIRTRFSQNKVLFGDIMMVGALEYEAYQDMKETGGFGVVPVPIYSTERVEAGDKYLTQIHNVGRPGAIVKNTPKFVECTAFLNYQSTHSTEILNNYYNYKLMYDIAGGAEGTVEMLQYIRLNVRTSFDKAFEDAQGVFHGDVGRENKVLIKLSDNDFQSQIITEYQGLVGMKNIQLDQLEDYYITAPD